MNKISINSMVEFYLFKNGRNSRRVGRVIGFECSYPPNEIWFEIDVHGEDKVFVDSKVITNVLWIRSKEI